MKKVFVIPSDLSNLGNILKTSIAGVILPLEHLSVNGGIYFTLEDIKSIINLTSKEVCVSLNKIMHDQDLKLLEQTLVSLNKMNIRKIFFYDLAVLNICKRLGIKKELVIYQDHLNASLYSNLFYQNRGVKYSVITNDITKEEIQEISKKNHLMMVAYGYLPIFYSRRFLIQNYFDYIGKDRDQSIYYLNHDGAKYPIIEEENGTTIYTKKPINLLSDIDDFGVDCIIMNAFLIPNDEFLLALEHYLNHEVEIENAYRGLVDKKTVYKVEDYE